MTKKSLNDFEEQFSGQKVKTLEKKLEAERKKVENLADVQHKISIINTTENTFKFAIIGDLHFGSLAHDNDSLRAFFEYAQKQGVTEFYLAGDVLDGHKMYKGHEFELRDVGMALQVERVAKDCPELAEDTTIYFIDGNHDASFKKLVGFPSGKWIERELPQWKYLGEDSADIKFKTPEGSFTLRIQHPGGGCSYAISYRLQKHIEQISGGNKPNMLALGHYHKTLLMPSYRNVCGVLTGCFQKQTPFMESKGLAAHLGGWIFEVCAGANRHNLFRSEFIAFYE